MANEMRLLDGSGASPVEVGGKAAALDRLIGWGFRVPPCAAVTTRLYQEAISDPQISPLIEELAGEPAPPPDRATTEDRRIEAAFVNLVLGDETEAALISLAHDLSGERGVAVRSSATGEDAAAASFAGQHRSLLDVQPEDVPRALKLVWASLWSSAARAYRQARGIDPQGVTMGAVVMGMVDADTAGVLFTADPQRPDSDLRIELVQGLGDQLVEGSVTPEVITLPRFGPAPAGREARNGWGGLTAQLASLAEQVEQHFGQPQDIEWAARGDQVFLLQSRPITTAGRPDPARTGDGFDSPLAEDASYTTAGVAETLPGVLPPLLWDINRPMLDGAFRTLFDRLGHVPGPDEQIVVRARGRAAINLDVLRTAATAAGGSAADLEYQLIGQTLTSDGTDSSTPDGGGWRTPVTWLRTVHLRHSVAREAAIVCEAIDGLVDREIPVDRLHPHELLAYRTHIHDLGTRAMASQVAIAGAAAAAYRALEAFLRRYVGADEATALSQSLTTGASATSPLGFDAVVSGADPAALETALENGEGGAANPEPRLAATAPGRQLITQVRSAARRAGSRAVFGGTTWDEDINEVWAAFRAHVGRMRAGAGAPDPDRVRSDLENRLTSDRRWRRTRQLTGQVVDVRLRLLRRLIADASSLLAQREDVKAALLRLGGESRRIVRRAGDLLYEGGIIEYARDVELLTEYELHQALSDSQAPAGDLAGRRKGLRHAHDHGNLPRVFTGYPDRTEPSTVPPADGSDQNKLEGWAAAPGKHRGRPRVVHNLASARLEPGEVLVARTTDPSWTSLFLTAGAVVVEEGGPLAHAAILARELGLPAVVNVAGAVDALDGAAEVTVDGDRGVVQIHQGVAAGETESGGGEVALT